MLSIARREEISMGSPRKNTTKNRDKKYSYKIYDSHHDAIEYPCYDYNCDNTSRFARSPYFFDQFSTSHHYLLEILEESLLGMLFFLEEVGCSEKRFIKHFFERAECISNIFRIVFIEHVSSLHIVTIRNHDVGSAGIHIRSIEKSKEKNDSDDSIKYRQDSENRKNRSDDTSTKSYKSKNPRDNRQRNTRPADDLEIVSFECHAKFIRTNPFIQVKSSFFYLLCYISWIFYTLF